MWNYSEKGNEEDEGDEEGEEGEDEDKEKEKVIMRLAFCFQTVQKNDTFYIQ